MSLVHAEKREVVLERTLPQNPTPHPQSTKRLPTHTHTEHESSPGPSTLKSQKREVMMERTLQRLKSRAAKPSATPRPSFDEALDPTAVLFQQVGGRV